MNSGLIHKKMKIVDHITVIVPRIHDAIRKLRNGKTRQYMTSMAILMVASTTTYTISSPKIPFPIMIRLGRGTFVACKPKPCSITIEEN